MNIVKRVREYLRFLGPGIITGASDNDPAGISTYSVVGAATGYGLLWLSLFTLPMLIAVQDMSAKIGLVTRRGLAEVIKENYGITVLIISVIAILISNTVTIGADLAGIAAAINLLIPGVKVAFLVPIAAIFIAALEVFVSYKTFERYLKWVLLILVAYIFAGIFAHPNWLLALYHTLVPTLQLDKAQLTAVVAVLGTTLSPYLLFWQASQEVEELKERDEEAVAAKELRSRILEVDFGFFFANLIFFFIILTTAATLNQEGITNIQTAEQAAQALRPIAGDASYLLFSIGLVASGLLAIPVLAGSTAYVVAELFGWREGLREKVRQAPGYYFTLVTSILAGISINFIKLNPIQAIYYSQVLLGIITPILLVVIMLISNDRIIMGDHVNGLPTNILGALAIIAMAGAATLFFVLQF
ncbi:MAG TPA: Nramp family divalent metal transporter [Anaerolineae bacterium]|nr:Nramp family divalent metal transporter [Anaerolineae bacterium]